MSEISKEMIDLKCDCGELIATIHKDLEGSMLIICPYCEETSSWMSIVSWDQAAEHMKKNKE